MAILIKVDPQELSPAPVTIEVPKTKAGIAGVGDTAFVWFAEKSGGRGLVARGTIDAITAIGSGRTSICVGELVTANQWLGNAQISPFRNSTEARPESSLAKKIYRYAHNRAVRLTDDEVSFLSQHVG